MQDDKSSGLNWKSAYKNNFFLDEANRLAKIGADFHFDNKGRDYIGKSREIGENLPNSYWSAKKKDFSPLDFYSQLKGFQKNNTKGRFLYNHRHLGEYSLPDSVAAFFLTQAANAGNSVAIVRKAVDEAVDEAIDVLDTLNTLNNLIAAEKINQFLEKSYTDAEIVNAIPQLKAELKTELEIEYIKDGNPIPEYLEVYKENGLKGCSDAVIYAYLLLNSHAEKKIFLEECCNSHPMAAYTAACLVACKPTSIRDMTDMDTYELVGKLAGSNRAIEYLKKGMKLQPAQQQVKCIEAIINIYTATFTEKSPDSFQLIAEVKEAMNHGINVLRSPEIANLYAKQFAKMTLAELQNEIYSTTFKTAYKINPAISRHVAKACAKNKDIPNAIKWIYKSLHLNPAVASNLEQQLFGPDGLFNSNVEPSITEKKEQISNIIRRLYSLHIDVNVISDKLVNCWKNLTAIDCAATEEQFKEFQEELTACVIPNKQTLQP